MPTTNNGLTQLYMAHLRVQWAQRRSGRPGTGPRRLARAYQNRGRLYDERDQADRAISDYSKSIRLYPYDGTVYVRRGLARALSGNLEGAVEDCAKAIRMNPDDAEAYFVCGLANERLGNLQRARQDFLKALELAPDDPEISEKARHYG